MFKITLTPFGSLTHRHLVNDFKKIQFIYLFIFYIISNIAFANFENSIVVKVDNEIITNFELKIKF